MFNNISYGVGQDGKTAEFPGAFVVKSFTLTNNRNKSTDIQKLIKNFTITEEIFSPTLVLHLQIIDNINLFEDYGLCGQEILEFTILKRDLGSKIEKEISLRFVTKEYPSFSRDSEKYDIQYYDIIAISELTYYSSLTKISRSVTGHTADNIKNIFVEDLSISKDRFIITGEPSTNFTGVLPINTPIKNAQWLVNHTYDQHGSPFILFQTILNKVQLSSISSLISDSTNPIYKTFVYRRDYQETPGGASGFQELAHRILGISSNLKLDKINQARQGAFASETRYVDIANKNITTRSFNHSTESSKALSLGKGKNYSGDFGVVKNGAALTLNDMTSAKINYVYTNPSSYGFSSENSNFALSESQHKAQSVIGNLQNESHDIIVYGDFALNVGRKINIDIPKAINYYNQQKFREPGGSGANLNDSSFSGKYLVFKASHRFEEGLYTTQLTIGRDSA